MSIAPDQRTLRFLKQNPAISESLISDAGHDFSRVVTIIGPVLDAPNRCEASECYIQAVTTGRTAFLTTNLADGCSTHVTGVATSWLLGRDTSCAISISSRSVSRCHAVIGHCPERGFYIMDVGSTNGTKVNRRRLISQELRFLQDGDLIELSDLQIEFFVSGWKENVGELQATYA